MQSLSRLSSVAAAAVASVPFFSPYSPKPSASINSQTRSPPPPVVVETCETHLQDIDACIGGILSAFLTSKMSFGFGPACCKAIAEISQDCLDVLIPVPFISQFIGPYIKELCSVP